jgi:hypothetical protein
MSPGAQTDHSTAHRPANWRITFANQQLKEQLAGLSAANLRSGYESSGESNGSAAKPADTTCRGFAAADFRYWTVTVAVEVVRPNSFVALSV